MKRGSAEKKSFPVDVALDVALYRNPAYGVAGPHNHCDSSQDACTALTNSIHKGNIPAGIKGFFIFLLTQKKKNRKVSRF